MNATMNEIKRTIDELTFDMDIEDYAAFMRELAEWAQIQADDAYYTEDFCDDGD